MKVMITARKPADLGGTWISGWTGDYLFTAKVYNGGSVYGIDEGQVSKLTVTSAATGTRVASYDRGWDVEPTRKADRAALVAILEAVGASAN